MITIGAESSTGTLGAHMEFDRKYEVEAARADYEDDDPPWPPGPRVLAHLPEQHAITLPKANHTCICICMSTYLSAYEIMLLCS